MKRWLQRHARFHIHFTPASSSWRNLVERLFAEITRQRIRRGTFTSVPELKAEIEDWIEHRNSDPKLFTWTKTSKKIAASYRRARNKLATLSDGCT